MHTIVLGIPLMVWILKMKRIQLEYEEMDSREGKYENS